MYKLSDKESTHIIVNMGHPLSWVALSRDASHDTEITDALVKRAYAVVSCRNPLLRAVYKPDTAKFSLVIRDISEVVQDEADGQLPAHTTTAFRTRDEAWAEYKRNVECVRWKCSAMWEVTVCILDRERSPDTAYAIFAHFNHAVTDGAAVMKALGDFVRVLNAGLTGDSTTLPPHNFLGESMPVPRPFHERYPLYKFVDAASDDAKEELFKRANEALALKSAKMRSMISDRSFTEEATGNFIDRCKRHGVSVTAGLFAVVAMASRARKFNSFMPFSFRTKENLDEVSMSFTSIGISQDFTSAWSKAQSTEDEEFWATLAGAFHKEIHAKIASDEEKYTGRALSFVHASFSDVPPLKDSVCFGPNNDEIFIGMSNVGVVDGYFEDRGPLRPTDVTGYCTNLAAPESVVWCYTFRGRFHISVLDVTPPDRREVFEAFTTRIFDIIGN